MKILRDSITLLVLAFLTLASTGAELDSLFNDRATLWEKSGDEISAAFPGYFRWTDIQKAQLRYNIESNKPLTFFGLPVQEAVVHFENGKPTLFSLSIYNRGDGQPISDDNFEALQKKLWNQLSAYLPNLRPTRMTSRLGDARIYGYAWRSGELDLLMRWSSSDRKKIPEYLYADIYAPGTLPGSLRSAVKTDTNREELANKIKSDPDGSRYMLLPMVDQGQKGYCVAATVERVLRFYGSSVDQHLIAQLAQSDADRGTNLNKAVAALEDVEQKLGIRYKGCYSFEGFDTFKDFERFIDDYNDAAKRQKRTTIPLKDHITVNRRQRTKTLDVHTILNALEMPVVNAVRQRDKRAFRQFVEDIRENIDKGYPLCWGTMVLAGQNGEAGTFGMHERIINGYNPRTNQIIYTDSWGFGHEKKMMKMDEAWAITVNLFVLIPRNRPVR